MHLKHSTNQELLAIAELESTATALVNYTLPLFTNSSQWTETGLSGLNGPHVRKPVAKDSKNALAVAQIQRHPAMGGFAMVMPLKPKYA